MGGHGLTPAAFALMAEFLCTGITTTVNGVLSPFDGPRHRAYAPHDYGGR